MILKKIFLELMNNEKCEKLWKNYGKCEKILRYYTCHNRKKKKLFSIAIKLSYYKVFHRKFISNRNEKNRYL